MNKKVKNLEKEIDKHEQYSCRNCLLVHRIVETDDEVTDDLVIDTISPKMNIEISLANLDRTHRIGKKQPGQNKPRPMILKLSRYNVTKKVFSNKKIPRGSNVSITESLIPKRKEILKKARIEHWFTNVWTSDGKILYKSATDNKVKLYYEWHWSSGMVIVAVNGSKVLCFLMLFTSFIFLKGGLVFYFFLFQNIYFSDNAPLLNNILIKNITENFLQFLISNLSFSLQKYCLDFTEFYKNSHVLLWRFNYSILNIMKTMSNATNYNFISNRSSLLREYWPLKRG